MRFLARLSASLALAGVLGCAELPEIPSGSCGNGAVEPPEDCDSRSRFGTSCRPPGAPFECRLDCTPEADGSASPCPAGWGCDSDRVCRRATGRYQMLSATVEGNAAKLLSGDFDGDARDDVVAVETPGVLGFTKLRVHWFDADAAPLASWPSPKPMATPLVADVSGDGRDDIAFSTGQVGVLLGEPTHSLIPETYPSYRLPSGSRFVALHDEQVEGAPPIVILTSPDDQPGLYRLDALTGVLVRVAELEASAVGLGAQPASGNLFEDDERSPCSDVVLGYRGSSQISIYSVCERDAETGAIVWREQAEVTVVELEPAAPIEGAILLADLEGDGHVDILIPAGDVFYAASGDGQSFGVARPRQLGIDGAAPADVTPPLAAGDLTGDALADFVYPRFLLLSERDGDSDVTYRVSHAGFRAPWSEAVIADFNGNGHLDVAAASSTTLDIDFLNGTGSTSLNAFAVPTTRPVEHLTIGDFDGDLIDDLAFVQSSAALGEDEVSVAFGNPFGAVGPVVPMAHLENVEQLIRLEDDAESRISSLFVTYDEMVSDGSRSSALAVFAGSGDRSLLAGLEITNFAANGEVRGAPCLSLAVGTFLSPGQRDVLPLTVSGELSNDELGLWILADMRSRQSVPQSLGFGFDVAIASVLPSEGISVVASRLAAGDLDEDGLDEVVLFAPEATSGECLLLTADLEGGSEPALRPRQVVRLGISCSLAGDVRIEDLNHDQALDIAFLDGTPSPQHPFFVFWNDGSGRFSVEEATRLDAELGAVEAFATLRGADGEAALAYTAQTEVGLLSFVDGGRGVAAREVLAPVEAGTGITAADVDGDRIVDLVVADGGSLRVLRAELAP